jgi:hypothetical protein
LTIIAEFLGAAAFTTLMWKAGLPIRSVSRKKDGPMSKADVIVIVVVGLAIFGVMAFSEGVRDSN